MNKYELALVFTPVIDDETRQAEMQKVQELIERFGGTIEKIDDWGKRRLAYEIKKLNEGYYNLVAFESDSSAPAEIESRVRIMENVLRYLIVRKEG